MSYTKMTIFDLLINILLNERNFSWPAVSQNASLIFLPLISIVLYSLSPPIVDCISWLKVFDMYCLINDVFPTEDSPINVILHLIISFSYPSSSSDIFNQINIKNLSIIIVIK